MVWETDGYWCTGITQQGINRLQGRIDLGHRMYDRLERVASVGVGDAQAAGR